MSSPSRSFGWAPHGRLAQPRDNHGYILAARPFVNQDTAGPLECKDNLTLRFCSPGTLHPGPGELHQESNVFLVNPHLPAVEAPALRQAWAFAEAMAHMMAGRRRGRGLRGFQAFGKEFASVGTLGPGDGFGGALGDEFAAAVAAFGA